MTVAEACAAYLRELAGQNTRKSTQESYRSLFRQLQGFASDAGMKSLRDIDREALRRWRQQRPLAPRTQARILAQLKAFFSFAQTEGWVVESPLSGVRPPRLDSRPTMPLDAEEIEALLEAARGKPQEQTLLLLMRYSGLAIRDAATLSRQTVKTNGDLVLRRAKSGELVTVALPFEVIAQLQAIAIPGRRHYFWTGRSEPVTAAKFWRERLKRVAEEAGVEGFHPHRLRDTFAVELLLAGVMIQDVSTLLGHRSVATTERHYAPWNLARRERLSQIVRKVHQRDPILLAFTPKKPAESVATPPAEASLATTNVLKPTRCAQAQVST